MDIGLVIFNWVSIWVAAFFICVGVQALVDKDYVFASIFSVLGFCLGLMVHS